MSSGGDTLGLPEEFRCDRELEEASIAQGPRLRSLASTFLRSGPTHDRSVAVAAILDDIAELRDRGVGRYCNFVATEISEIPPFSRTEIRARPWDFISPHRPISDWWVRYTSGTTGPPLPIIYSTDFMMEFLHLPLFKILRTRDVEIGNDSGVFCVAIGDNPTYPETLIRDPTGLVGPTIQVNLRPQDPRTLARVISLINFSRPRVITSKPSIYELIVAWLRAGGDVIATPPAAIISSGSQLPLELRQSIQNEIHAPVIDAYAMTEFGLIASECPNGRLHLHSSKVYLESLPTSAGDQQEIVISSGSNDVMPLFRYRTGDGGQMHYGSCGCGLETPQIVQLNGRLVQCFRFRSGLLTPTQFNELFDHFALAEFQMEQVDETLVAFRYQRAAFSRWSSEDRLRLEATVRSKLPSDVRLLFSEHEFESTGKFQRYRTLLPTDYADEAGPGPVVTASS